MKHFFGLLSIVLLFSGCEPKGTQSSSKGMTDSIKRELLKYTILEDTAYTSKWRPSENQIRSFELLIKDAIKENQSENNSRLKPDSLYRYYRQYTCFIENGDSLVLVNAFCDVDDTFEMKANGELVRKRFDWQHQQLLVKDGGDCYWQTVINFSKRRTKIFIVNGRA